MSPSNTSPAASSALPPLPNLQTGKGQGEGQSSMSPMSSVIAGVAPVKQGVDMIMQGCKGIVDSNAVPGAEQVCQQIIALATSLLPMAVQQAMQPAGQQPQGIPQPIGA